MAASTRTVAVGTPTERFEAFGGIATVATADPAALGAALEAARHVVELFDRACSRFRGDSELTSLADHAGAPTTVGPVLRDTLAAALDAAALTQGAVDPTVGGALVALGYDRDFDELPRRGAHPRLRAQRVPGWRTVELDRARRIVRIPPGTILDLGATAKALAADRAAALAGERAGCGVLVSFSGDLAIAGEPPAGGWTVRVTDDHRAGPDAPGQTIAVADGGVATSSAAVTAVGDRRGGGPSPDRPRHRPARHQSMAHGHGGGGVMPAGERRQHRGDHPRPRGAATARRGRAAGSPGVGGRDRDPPTRVARRRRGDAGRGVVMTILASSAPTAYWYLARGTGVVSLILFTAVLALGLAGTLRVAAGPRWPRFALDTLHRDLSLLAVALLVVHIATSLLDGYAPIRLIDAVVPFLSPYRPLWLGLGALALDIIVALVITSLVRRRLGYGMWRAIHWLAYLSWPVAVLHGLGTGSDTKAGWMLLLTAVCVAIVAGALVVRIQRADGDRVVRGVAAAATVLGVVAGVVFTIQGPLQRGWAARAGTPVKLIGGNVAAAGPGRRVSTVAAAAGAVPFTASLRGTLRSRPAGTGELLDFNLRLLGSTGGVLRIRLAGLAINGGGLSLAGSQVDLAIAGQRQALSGRVVSLDGTRVVARVGAPGAGSAQLDMQLNLPQSGDAVTGTVQASAAG